MCLSRPRTSDLDEAKRRYVNAVADIKVLAKVTTQAPQVTLGSTFRSLHGGGDWGDAKDKRGIQTRWVKVREFFGGGCVLVSITRRRMEEFVQWMREHKDHNGDQRYGAKTVHKHLALVSKMLRSAAENDLITGMPMVPWPKVKKGGNIRWYTQEEESLVVEWFETHAMPEMAALMVFLIDSGFRRGEAVGPFRVSDGCAILGDQKVSEAMTMTRLTKRAEVAARAKPWAGLTASVLNKRWEKMRDALGMGKGASLHACRHTTATRLALAHVPLKSIQKFMRHTSETVTLIYINFAEDAGAGAVDALEGRAKSVPPNGTK